MSPVCSIFSEEQDSVVFVSQLAIGDEALSCLSIFLICISLLPPRYAYLNSAKF